MAKNEDEMISEFNEIIIEDKDFLKIKETLTRIGVPNKGKNVLNQSCHILHKRGKYYIVHFKEMYALDGKPSQMTEEDYVRRDKITNLIVNWGLAKLVKPLKYVDSNINCYFYVVKYKEKHQWELRQKHKLGNFKQEYA